MHEKVQTSNCSPLVLSQSSLIGRTTLPTRGRGFPPASGMALRPTLDKHEDRSRFVGEQKREAAIFASSTPGATVHIPFALGDFAASGVMFPNSTLRCPEKRNLVI